MPAKITLPPNRPQALQSRSGPLFRGQGRRFDAVQAAEADGEVDLYLYEEIDGSGYWGVSADMMRRKLYALRDAKLINLRINSPGGDVFEGVAIYNDLVDASARVRVHVTGLAASAASLIAMAGDEIIMAPGAMMMIHEPWVMAIGGQDDLRQSADLLGEINDAMIEIYSARTGLGADELRAMLAEETWMAGGKAAELGFADEAASAGDPVPASARACVWDVTGVYAKAPKPPLPAQPTVRDAAAALALAGFENPGALLRAPDEPSADDPQADQTEAVLASLRDLTSILEA